MRKEARTILREQNSLDKEARKASAMAARIEHSLHKEMYKAMQDAHNDYIKIKNSAQNNNRINFDITWEEAARLFGYSYRHSGSASDFVAKIINKRGGAKASKEYIDAYMKESNIIYSNLILRAETEGDDKILKEFENGLRNLKFRQK